MKTVGLELALGWRDAMEVASSPLTYSVRAMFSDYNSESNILLIGLPRYNYTVKGSFDWYGADFSFIMNGTGKQEWNQLENLQWDTYFAKDNLNAGFFRVKNVSLGYTFKFKKIIEGIRVGVSGENLCYASPFKMYSKSIDPQLLFSPASLSQYQRQLLFNVKVNF